MVKRNYVGIYVGSKIPHSLKVVIEKAVKKGSYLNISDFIWNAIKEKLQREGLVPIERNG